MSFIKFFVRSFRNQIRVNTWRKWWDIAAGESSRCLPGKWCFKSGNTAVSGSKSFRWIDILFKTVMQCSKDIGLVRFAPAEVPELDEGNFLSYLKSNGRVFVMWYDPLCPVCRKAGVYFDQLYQEMKGSLAFGMIDALSNPDLAMAQDVNAFPTFRLYTCNGNCRYKHHEGLLTLDEMKNFVRFAILGEDLGCELRSNANPGSCVPSNHPILKIGPSLLLNSPTRFCIRLECAPNRHFSCSPLNLSTADIPRVCNTAKADEGVRNISCTPCIRTVPTVPRDIKVGTVQITITKNVMEVTGKNFQEKIGSFDSALVYFYATWCVHCGRTLKEYIKAADLIEDSVGALAMCNVEESLEIVDKYYVGKIPTVKYFRKGRYITDYIGETKVDLLVKFMKEPQNDSEFIMKVTKHKPLGDLHEGEILVPTRKRKMWHGKDGSNLILEVTKDNIDKVLQDNPSFMLLFYTCWSKICIGLNHDYIVVAKAVEKGDVVLGAVDCEEHVEVADKYLITKFPTIKYFRNGQVMRDFNGDYRAESILKFLRDPSKLHAAVKASPELTRQEDLVPPYWKGVPGGEKLLHFTDFNYKALIQNHPSIFLMFYVPWCKPCTAMKRDFAQAAMTLDKKFGVLAACDAERNNEVADAFTVLKLPTLKYIRKGEHVRDYTGQRRAQDFVAFMESPPETGAFSQLPKFKAGKS